MRAADRWARATGEVGASIGTSGLAGVEMIAGLGTALATSVPRVCIAEQPAMDIAEIARSVTRGAV